MTWIAPAVDRRPEPTVGSERTLLEEWLDYHRETLLLKCSGLNHEQLASTAVLPSSLSLLGLVRHMAEVERSWFRTRFGGRPELGYIYCTDSNMDADFDDVGKADAQADFVIFNSEVALARETVVGRSLEDTFVHQRRQTELTLRWVYLHMIEEYARHNGHADLLRERIDGRTGD